MCLKVISFFATLCFILGVSLENIRVRRSDIDLQTCIDNFNVHRDKIIRTQDSQNMGAKYLNEIDLGSREECLRLCCETVNCDVFVFEEKNSGSCYLFHCGPPEDFKCKFTHHVNYSSAVLSINRHLPDLESQIKLTKHEQDLTKLRRPEMEQDVLKTPISEVKTTYVTTTTTGAPKEEEVIPLRNGKTLEDSRKCSRFQFECRSTGECIAIYNACDGVPQCADGSDEAPELGCPDLIMTTALPQPPQQPLPPPQPQSPHDVPTNDRYNEHLQSPSNSNPQSLYQPQMLREPSGRLNQMVPHQEQDFLRPANDPKNIHYQMPYDPQPYVPPMSMQGQSNWIPHQSNQMPPQYDNKNTHIFNHKESGLQVPDGQEIRYNKYRGAMQYLHRALGYSGGGGPMQYADSINSGDYNKMNNYYADGNYRQPIQQENWPADVVGYNENQNYLPEKIHSEDLDRKAIQYKPVPVLTPDVKSETVNPKHVQEKLAHDLKHSKENMVHGNTDHEKVKIEKHSHHKQQYPDVVAYRIDDTNDLQDGLAQTPRGAVLSVTLGLIITFVMAIMIGCRLRMVRRRIRRGGKSYAHDADYLVNGMYL